MALARVVTFDGVSKERMDELNKQMESGEPPEGMPAAELIVRIGPEASTVDAALRGHPAHRVLVVHELEQVVPEIVDGLLPRDGPRVRHASSECISHAVAAVVSDVREPGKPCAGEGARRKTRSAARVSAQPRAP